MFSCDCNFQASRDLLKQWHIDCAQQGLSREEKRRTPLPKGAESPYRNRSVEDNLKLFRAMKVGWSRRCAQPVFR